MVAAQIRVCLDWVVSHHIADASLLSLMQGKDFHISAANLWLWSVVVFMLMLVTFGIGAATGGPSIPQLSILP